MPAGATAIPWRVAPPLVSTALTMLGAGVLGSLLPLRFSAMGLSPGMIGLIATAEALGFLVGCLYAHKIIAPVGLERAYAAFAGMKAVAILGLYFAEGISGARAAAVPDRIERCGLGHHRRKLAERTRAERRSAAEC